MSLLRVTFDLYHAPLLAWQKPPNSGLPVEDPGEILQAQSGWRRGCQCVKGWGGGVGPPMLEVNCFVVWWNGTDGFVCILMLLRLCGIGAMVGLP